MKDRFGSFFLPSLNLRNVDEPVSIRDVPMSQKGSVSLLKSQYGAQVTSDDEPHTFTRKQQITICAAYGRKVTPAHDCAGLRALSYRIEIRHLLLPCSWPSVFPRNWAWRSLKIRRSSGVARQHKRQVNLRPVLLHQGWFGNRTQRTILLSLMSVY